MPQALTPEEASIKICPFMNARNAGNQVKCGAEMCACWGWIDPNRGQLSTETFESFEETTTNVGGSRPAGEDWRIARTNSETVTWRRIKAVGPRRGQCEAMSPTINVECGH